MRFIVELREGHPVTAGPDGIQAIIEEAISSAGYGPATVTPVTPPPEVVTGIDGDGVLVCGQCLTSAYLQYRENVGEWREVDRNEDGIVNVVWKMENHDEGDGNPGLVCSQFVRGVEGSGCGQPVGLPAGWQITYDDYL